ncbi:glycosyltransferase family 1 protein [Kribbella antibiotica]|uniref:Glycosyltransferase family 1 protein n=1 Tax=Kribbella antibiotica TaxID=190195 RepID=A0A4R4Z2G7_9ACTN|nr:glycosyltransferase family 1 protein [Kribbella antibiotica]TDD52145.1 glycosyltransferase family 1 protein [Kribbella antibiotica]
MTQPDLRVVLLVSTAHEGAAVLAEAGTQVTVLRPSATRESSKQLVDGALVVGVPLREPQVGDRHKAALIELKADIAHRRIGRVEQLLRRAWLKVLKFDRRLGASKEQELELTFGGLIDRLRPDVVYAQDAAMLAVATRAADRAKLQKRALGVVRYEAGTDQAKVAPTRSRTHERRLLIGPVNSAGQAWLWANALEHAVPGLAAEALSTTGARYAFAAHRTATDEQYKSDLRWQFDLTAYVLAQVSHVLFEAGRPLFGQRPGQLWTSDVPTLERAGIKHGVIFHGSEIRDPAKHRELFAHSPFQNADDDFTRRLQAANEALRRHLASYEGPVFVTTPDLLEFVDNGTWLPLTVDVDALATDLPVMEREVPVVLHAPSSGALKGSAYVDPVLTDLDARGLIEYQRVEGVRHAELAELVKNADIVVDQLMLGSYGVLACEAMAAGRVTVGHIADRVRALLPTELPIAEATPGDLGAVIERLVSEREASRKLADGGAAYVRELHDGRRAVEALLPFLGGR